MTTLFVSDLHLDPSRPQITALFSEFLRTEAAEAEGLFILGDLFEAWVGDDDDAALAQEVRAALFALSRTGVPVSVMRGNRDFLLGPRFAAECGIRLLPDPCMVSLHGLPTLLMHGDLLCTDDLAYQAVRAQVRDPAWQQDFLSRPLPARRAFADNARAQSQQHQAGLLQSGQLERITDVNESEVIATLARYGVSRLMHGHTHRPAIHSVSVHDRVAQRVVLGDWYEQGSVLRVSADGVQLSTL